jgi:hypothetical protein
MVRAQIQVELSDKANYNVSLYKLKNELKTKEEAVNKMLENVKVKE